MVLTHRAGGDQGAVAGVAQASSTGQGFAAALEASGYVLARGYQRGFVAVDPAGEVHAINKKPVRRSGPGTAGRC